MKDKVSVVITTYKREFPILQRAIISVLNQTYNNIEIIVVNDNDKNNGYYEQINQEIKMYESKLTYISLGVNKGACSARNQGALRSTGKYIAFLDDDDIYKKNKIEKQVEFLKKNSAEFVSCLCDITDGTRKKRNLFRHIHTKIKLKDLWKRNYVGGCSRPLMLKETFLKVGMYSEELSQSQDYDLWIRMAMVCPIYCIQEPLIEYSVSDPNSISKNYQKIIASSKILIDKYKNIKGSEPFIKRMNYVVAYAYLNLNNIEQAKIYYSTGKKIKAHNKFLLRYSFKIFILKSKLRFYQK